MKDRHRPVLDLRAFRACRALCINLARCALRALNADDGCSTCTVVACGNASDASRTCGGIARKNCCGSPTLRMRSVIYDTQLRVLSYRYLLAILLNAPVEASTWS